MPATVFIAGFSTGGRQLPLHAQPPPGLPPLAVFAILSLPHSLWRSEVQSLGEAWRDGYRKITHIKGTGGNREGLREASSLFIFNKNERTQRKRRMRKDD